MAQFLRPWSDVTTTNWTRSTGTNAYYTYIDESTADSADYVQTQVQGAALEVTMSTASVIRDPISATGHIVRIQELALGSAAGEQRTVLLLQGSTTIATVASGTVTRNTPTTTTYTLTVAQCDAITDYSDLRLRFTTTTMASGETYRLSWAEMEFPDPANRRVFIV